MMVKRKENDKEDLAKQKKAWDEANPSHVE